MTTLILQKLAAGDPVAMGVFDDLTAPSDRDEAHGGSVPARTAVQAALWLAHRGARRVLELRSGSGKGCLLGALTTPLCFTGVEPALPLVRNARSRARALGVESRASFLYNAVENVELSVYDAFTCFQPVRDRRVSPKQREGAAEVLQRAVDTIPRGAWLVTSFGLDGLVPTSLALERRAPVGGDVLRIWRKA